MQGHDRIFHFRKFDLIQNDAVWKVGTDSVLLGSWCSVTGFQNALDIGAGTGILSIMLAQRSSTLRIIALEVQDEAFSLMKRNIESTPWSDRMTPIHGDINDQGLFSKGQFDLIIGNPPYFPDGLASTDRVRRSARQGMGYSIENICAIAEIYLHSDGIFSVVIPAGVSYSFIDTANTVGLYVQRRMDVRKEAGSAVSLVLLEFSRVLGEARHESLVLYDGYNNPTSAYQALCREFYRYA